MWQGNGGAAELEAFPVNAGLGTVQSLNQYAVTGNVNLPEGHASSPKGIVLQFPGAEVRATVLEGVARCSFDVTWVWRGAALFTPNQTLHSMQQEGGDEDGGLHQRLSDATGLLVVVWQEAAEDNTEDDGEQIPAAAKSQEKKEVRQADRLEKELAQTKATSQQVDEQIRELKRWIRDRTDVTVRKVQEQNAILTNKITLVPLTPGPRGPTGLPGLPGKNGVNGESVTPRHRPPIPKPRGACAEPTPVRP